MDFSASRQWAFRQVESEMEVRCGSISEVGARNREVCFAPMNGHRQLPRTAALRRFCCRNRHADGAGRLVPFLKPSVATRWVVRAAYARLY